MYDITSSICETFCPLYLWHRTHYVWHHKPLCWLHHTRHMYDIICTTEDITSSLSLQATIFMTSHPLQEWHQTPCFRHLTNCIFVITTSPLISHPLCMTSYALYITSYPILVSSHYSTYDSTNLTYETTSSMQFKYTLSMWHHNHSSVSSHPLFVWHHARHRYNIFCTIEDITSSLYEIKPPFLWNHTHYIWSHIYAISVTTFTLLMISHQLYLWDLILYICPHHIHCIQQHIHCSPNSLWFYHHNHCTCVSHPLFPWYHTFCIYDIALTICLTSDTLYKVSHPHFMTSPHIISDITGTVFMTSLPQYLTLHA